MKDATGKKSQGGRPPIPDGQPMSPMTLYRRRKAAGLTRPHQKYPFNESFFDEWSENLAWLVGVIWSDGCLSRTTLEIATNDRQLADLAAAMMSATGVVPKNKGTALRVLFSSPRVSAWLRSIGLTERKSFTIKWPLIPKCYEGAFVRGVLDGDGSVLLRQTRQGQQVADLIVHWYTASMPFRDGLSAWLNRHHIRHAVGLSHTTVWRITVVRQADLRRLYDLLYPHEEVACLHRKHAPYIKWMETPRCRSGRPSASTFAQSGEQHSLAGSAGAPSHRK